MSRFHELFFELYGYEPAIEIPTQPMTKSEFHTTLITYPDSYGNLSRIDAQLPFDSIHILPFVSSSGDGGFAISDYDIVDPRYGSWEDISQIARRKNVVADLILNHVSIKHKWFQSFIAGGEYKDFFLSFESPPSEYGIYRPRAEPLFKKFKTAQGIRYVWTTFSREQADLNYNNPDVLFAMLEVVKGLIQRGIKVIRLDAVGYVGKELGTSCFHHPKTFLIVELFSEYVKSIDPSVRLLSEIVDSQENIDKYLGHSDFVYDFRPGSATLFALATQTTNALYRIDPHQTRFAVISTHDGTSLNSSVLSETEQRKIAKGVKGYRNVNGKRIAYELQSSFRSMANSGFYVAHAYLLFCFQRCGVYYRCLHDVGNNYTAALRTKEGRYLNRGPVVNNPYDAQLLKLISLRYTTRLLTHGHTTPIPLRDGVYCCLRTLPGEGNLLVLLNFTKTTQRFGLLRGLFDLVSEREFSGELAAHGFVVLGMRD